MNNQDRVKQALVDAFGPPDGKEHDPAVVQIFTAMLDRRDAEWVIAFNEVLKKNGLSGDVRDEA